MNGSGLSAGDLALLRDNDGMFGGNGVWAIFLFFLLAWGGNGFGFGNRGGMSYDVPATKDFVSNEFNNQSVINKLNGLENGLCDGFYALNNCVLMPQAKQTYLYRILLRTMTVKNKTK